MAMTSASQRVGAGPERKRGTITGNAAIIVTVRSKKARTELEAAGATVLPDAIDGIAVDVIEQGSPVEVTSP